MDPRAPYQCKHNLDIIQTYKIYKYIQNIYVSFDRFQCFATMMHFLCVFQVCAVDKNQIRLD